MKQGILVVTWNGGSEPCEMLLRSLWNVPYPVLVVVNNGKEMSQENWKKLYTLTGEQNWRIHDQPYDSFEIGAIKVTLEKTDWEEFFVLQDTFEVKNKDLFRRVFEEFPGQSVSYNPYLQMYLFKYRREILEKMNLPEVRSKRESIRLEEVFNREYEKLDGNLHIFNPRFRDDAFYGNYEERFGRKNLKLEDDYLIKRKGTWTTEQIPLE